MAQCRRPDPPDASPPFYPSLDHARLGLLVHRAAVHLERAATDLLAASRRHPEAGLESCAEHLQQVVAAIGALHALLSQDRR